MRKLWGRASALRRGRNSCCRRSRIVGVEGAYRDRRSSADFPNVWQRTRVTRCRFLARGEHFFVLPPGMHSARPPSSDRELCARNNSGRSRAQNKLRQDGGRAFVTGFRTLDKPGIRLRASSIIELSFAGRPGRRLPHQTDSRRGAILGQSEETEPARRFCGQRGNAASAAWVCICSMIRALAGPGWRCPAPHIPSPPL